MAHRPAALGVQVGAEIGAGLIQDFLRPELVKPQQPVGLVQPVLPHQGRLGVQGGQAAVLCHRDVGRVKDPLEAVLVVQPLGEPEDLVVSLGGGSHNHLGALARRGEGGRMAVKGQLLPAGGSRGGNLAHGAEDFPAALVGGQQVEAALAGQLNVDAEAVGQAAQPLDQGGAGAGDGLGVDVAVEAVFLPQQPQHLDHPLGGVVGCAQHGAGQEQTLDVVAAVKGDGQIGQLPGGKGGPGQVVAAAVDAIGTVKGTAVGHQHLQQADAPAVGGEGMAAAGGIAAAQPPGPAPAARAAGGAGHIVFGAVGQNGQFFHHRLFHDAHSLGPGVTTWSWFPPPGLQYGAGSGPRP